MTATRAVAPLTIALETPDQPDARALLAASDAYMKALYPPQSNHLLDVASLLAANVSFVIARSNGTALGCGALVLERDGTAEIKRMWVEPAARGHGTGRRILEALEDLARRGGIRLLRLEAGIAQPEALRLYRHAGFGEIAAFGRYAPDPLSIFMEKPLV